MRFTIIKTAIGYQKILYNDTKKKQLRVLENVIDKDVIAILKHCYLEKIKTIKCVKLISQAFRFNTVNKNFHLIIRYLCANGSKVENIKIPYTDIGFTKEMLENVRVDNYEYPILKQ